jgi:hypothetical protein
VKDAKDSNARNRRSKNKQKTADAASSTPNVNRTFRTYPPQSAPPANFNPTAQPFQVGHPVPVQVPPHMLTQVPPAPFYYAYIEHSGVHPSGYNYSDYQGFDPTMVANPPMQSNLAMPYYGAPNYPLQQAQPPEQQATIAQPASVLQTQPIPC